ncbi:hypothetical protein BsIDN1_50150 [Bacillus safensis]|uniref:Uncharacterized protein n=1 Tax=Bacillus safensis TaxID=561879 RepID=A0A5S9MD58_BACIA|nr:hypothetical protein BsIDN1_50150 [Bacillus safensis]
MHAEHNEVDQMIASLEDSKKQAEEELHETEVYRKEAEKKLHKELQRQILEWNEQKDKLLEEAEKKSGRKKIEQASKEAEDIIQELRSIKNEHRSFKEHELIDARKRLEEAVPEFDRKKKPEPVKKKQQDS